MSTEQVDLYKEVKTQNVLHYFRSYSYNLTMAAYNPDKSYEDCIDKYVVARSAGKLLNTISTDTKFTDVIPTIQGFNERSGGRFNFYFDELNVRSWVATNKQTGYAIANNIEFAIIEPFSVAGFVEACEVAALAASGLSYQQCNWLLKIEFVGYPSFGESLYGPPPSAQKIEPATRYILFKTQKFDIDVSEKGCKYRIKCLPANEIPLGEAGKTSSTLSATGQTVKEALKTLETAINDQVKAKAKLATAGNQSPETVPVDEYYIKMPLLDDKGNMLLNPYQENEEMGNFPVGDINSGTLTPAMANPTHQLYINSRVSRTPTPSMNFSNGTNIHDIIAGILRDSDYCKRIFTSDYDSLIDAEGMLPWFNIVTSAKIKPNDYDYVRNKPTSIYTYYVVPYKIHSTRVPGNQGSYTWDNSKTGKFRKKYVVREYNYLYNGANLDILKFDMNLNYLYFQPIPNNAGNSKSPTGNDAAVSKPAVLQGQENKQTPEENRQSTGVASPPSGTDQSASDIQASGVQTRSNQGGDPYDAMVKTLNNAILDNPGQLAKVTMEIIGDPYYLQGLVNPEEPTKALVASDSDTTAVDTSGSAKTDTQPLYIGLEVGSAVDYQSNGIMELNKAKAFSGVFWVNQILHKFKEGSFTQEITMSLMLGQPEQTNQEPSSAPVPSPVAPEKPTISSAEYNSTIQTLLSIRNRPNMTPAQIQEYDNVIQNYASSVKVS
jgi:hypothetical protein